MLEFPVYLIPCLLVCVYVCVLLIGVAVRAPAKKETMRNEKRKVYKSENPEEGDHSHEK